MKALLAKHVDGSFINLLNNNPFRCSEKARANVTLGFGPAATDVPPHARFAKHAAHASSS